MVGVELAPALLSDGNTYKERQRPAELAEEIINVEPTA
jgi:hypothetical protein